MLFDRWNVLLVDDEPDILTVTKLALRDVEVFGLPLQIYTATSKAAAIELLHNELAVPGQSEGSLAVAFIDVVMENEHAGLELCEYIRNTLGNQTAQLFIRTGQPGVAPERAVIDQYDISGYFTKVETTEQKLYSFVKSGIRQWYSFYYAKVITDQTNLLFMNGATKQGILDLLRVESQSFDDNGRVSGIVFEDIVCSDFAPEAVYTLRDELQAFAPVLTTPEGHALYVDGKRLLVDVAETANTARYFYVADGEMVMPASLLNITFTNGIILSTLWKRAL